MANRYDGDVVWLLDDELLYRQVHPAQMTGLEPNSTAFNPSGEHEFTLSTSREWIGAEGAYFQHITSGLISAGSWAVSVDEYRLNQLYPFDDSARTDMPPAHVSIPFGTAEIPETKGTRRAKAQKLRDHAIARGCRYRPAGF
jgi:hypothetical protein